MFCLLLLKWKGDGGEGGLPYPCAHHSHCHGRDECGPSLGMSTATFCVVYRRRFKIHCSGLCSGGTED